MYSNALGKGIRIRKQTTDKWGYCRIKLTRDGGTLRIHREVLKAFDREPSYIRNKMDNLQMELCRHLDGDPQNNHIHNLKWGPPQENSADSLQPKKNPNQSYAKKYSDEVIAEIREWSNEGASYKDISRMYGVSRGYISYIINQKSRKGV